MLPGSFLLNLFSALLFYIGRSRGLGLGIICGDALLKALEGSLKRLRAEHHMQRGIGIAHAFYDTGCHFRGIAGRQTLSGVKHIKEAVNRGSVGNVQNAAVKGIGVLLDKSSYLVLASDRPDDRVSAFQKLLCHSIVFPP